MSKILWGDDEPWYMAPFRDHLKADGHQVDCTESVPETLRKLREAGPGAYDLLIFDIMQPALPLEEQLDLPDEQLREVARRGRWGGVEIYRAARELSAEQPILIFSVKPESDVREHFPDVEFHCSFLRKGGPSEDFYNHVNALLKNKA